MNVMIVAPHPDDEVIGCGGSIIKHVNNSNSVTVIYITSGESGDPNTPKEKLKAIREIEATNGLEILGVKNYEFLRIPDGNVSLSPDNILKLTVIFRKYKPELLYIPHKNDAHRDHRKTFSLSIESVFRAGADAFQENTGETWQIPNIFTYEIWTPLENYQYSEDITTVMDKKIQALKCHKSQIANVDYDEAVKGLNRYRGALGQNSLYSECFGVIKINSI